MKKRNFLFAAALIAAGSMVAQEGTTVTLLPDGVTANIDQAKRFDQTLDLEVTGSKEKGYVAFFAATDADHGTELWVTDGTPEGTRMVKDIAPGVTGSDVRYLTRFNDKVVFQANDGDNGSEPWISDGTEEGTYMLADVHELDGSNARNFCQVNETQFVFFATSFDSESAFENPQQWLYVSDGTEEGTALLKEVDCQAENEATDHRYGQIQRVGRQVFFMGDYSDKEGMTTGYELWATDGTEEGTRLVKDINWEANVNKEGSTNNAAIAYMTNYDNRKLFFKAWDPDHGNEPWATDGTEEGTYMIYDTNGTKNESGIGNGGGVTMVGEVYNGLVCFRGWSDTNGNELGVTNMEEGNYTNYDIFTTEPTLDNSAFPDHGVVFDNCYVFCATDGFDAANPDHHGGELRVFDGEKVTLQYDLGPGNACDWIKELTVCGGSLYWWNEGGYGEGTTTKLHRLDKLSGVPTIVSNIDASGDQIHTLRNLDGTLLYSSKVNNQLYAYTYRQEGYDETLNARSLEIEFDPAGVEEVKANTVSKAAVVYPTVTSTSFSVKANGNADVKVYDLAGRLQMAKNVRGGVAISVADLAAGYYKVVVTTGNTTTSSSLIVK